MGWCERAFGEGPFPLREWCGGEDVVPSEMVKAHLMLAVGSHRRAVKAKGIHFVDCWWCGGL